MIDPLTPPPTPFALVSSTKVPNIQPTVSVPYKLAIIGEAPGKDEEGYGIPFVGASGKFLDSILATTGILRSGCFIGNVCKYRPPSNDIKEFDFDPAKRKYGNSKVQEGWSELQEELSSFRPNTILALGNTPLWFLCGKHGISNWQASILHSPWGKVIPAVHPAAVLREYKQWVQHRHAVSRARAQSAFPELHLPQRLLETHLSTDDICSRLDHWPAGRLLSFDIEGGLDSFPCCSVAGESDRGFIIAWSSHSERDQGRIAVSLSRVLYRDDVPKVLQNSLYDRFVLAYGYRMFIRGVAEDTMDKQWAIYPELKKSLGTIASIWTEEPYYKFERKTDDPNVYYEYCIKDSCVTLEASLAMDRALSERERRHYKFNVALKNPLLYMELRGFNYDIHARDEERARVDHAMAECASRLALHVKPEQWSKKECSSDLRGSGGAVSSLRLKKVFYEQKAYPPQYKGRGPDKKLTTDVTACLAIAAKRPNDPFLSEVLLHRKLEGVREALAWKTDPDGRIRCSYNQFSKGEDNTEEGGGATDTGRLRCSESITGSGGNLQTVTKKLRRLYRADDGMFLFQCDLAGADGWTVAARCSEHGDTTMWDDYSFGLKPALIIVLLYLGAATNKTSRVELARLSTAYKTYESENPREAWLYFGCKRIQHASNYGVQAKTGVAQILKDSFNLTGKAVHMPIATFEALQRLYYVRYHGIYAWHRWAGHQVMEGKNLISASGHERKFFGRRVTYNYKTRQREADHDTWKEFLADEPQENTTYATNLAMSNLWNDPTNRIGGLVLPDATDTYRATRAKAMGGLVIEPIHQVHDALIGQFPQDSAAACAKRITGYFHNELLIAQKKVIIPFEGEYGPSWGELGKKHGGGTIGNY